MSDKMEDAREDMLVLYCGPCGEWRMDCIITECDTKVCAFCEDIVCDYHDEME